MRPEITTTWVVGISTTGGVIAAAVVFSVFVHNTGGSAIAQQYVPLSAHYEDDPLGGSSVLAIQSGASLLDSALGVTPEAQPGPGLPVRLMIPGINVDSAVEFVGLTTDGIMEVPKNRDDVAWLKLGVRPGEPGSSVMAGHFGVREGKGSVFDNLHTLRKGDTLYIEDDLGARISFVVREIRRYDPSADAAVVFGASDDISHLNLITCEGIWDDALNGYPARLVVFTDRIDGDPVEP